MNSYVNFQTSSKKSRFGNTKCKKIHIGKTHDDYKFQDLHLEKVIENSNIKEMGIGDI